MRKLLTALCFSLLAGLAPQANASKAVNFIFTDTKGRVHQLSDYRGKWVLVNFWAPWCPRCKMEFPDLNDLDALDNFVVIGVVQDYGIDEASVLNTIARYNLRFPQILGGSRRDPNSPALQVGPVDYYPTSYLYAPDGEIVMFIPGVVSRQKLTAFMKDYEERNPTAVAAKAGATKAAEAPPAATVPGHSTGIKNAGFPKTIGKPADEKAENKKKISLY